MDPSLTVASILREIGCTLYLCESCFLWEIKEMELSGVKPDRISVGNWSIHRMNSTKAGTQSPD